MENQARKRLQLNTKIYNLTQKQMDSENALREKKKGEVKAITPPTVEFKSPRRMIAKLFNNFSEI